MSLLNGFVDSKFSLLDTLVEFLFYILSWLLPFIELVSVITLDGRVLVASAICESELD